MAYDPIPNDPYRPGVAKDDIRRPSRLDNELQTDPELAAKMARQPAVEFVPQGYVPGMALQQMGLHWTQRQTSIIRPLAWGFGPANNVT